MTREEALDILGSYMTTNEKECWTPFDEGIHYAIQAIEKLEKIDQLINHWVDYRKGQIEGYGGNEYLRKIQEVLDDEQRRV